MIMLDKIRYITHPQVLIDPELDVRKWSLSDLGRSRMALLAASGALTGTTTIISSAGTKARETAAPLAEALGCDITLREDMHENDRSATGYLPSHAFETAADEFFAHPTISYHGWETARAAQSRIVAAFFDSLRSATDGDILFVGHGAVGTLLYCHLANLPISRIHDQPPGGGSFFELSYANQTPISGWRTIEALALQAP